MFSKPIEKQDNNFVSKLMEPGNVLTGMFVNSSNQAIEKYTLLLSYPAADCRLY